MNQNKKGITAYIIGLLLFAVIAAKILGNSDYLILIRDISYLHIALSLIITFFLFFINGYTIAFLAAQQFKTPIKLLDTAMLPFMMHLWSYIIPFRGGLLFSAIFLKMKYKIKGTESIAIGVYTLFISMMITGSCGVYFTFRNNILFSFWTVISLLLVLSPIIVYILEQVLDRLVFNTPSILNSTKEIISSVNSGTRKLLQNRKISIVILLFNVASIVVYIFFISWITFIFHINTGLENIIMFALMMRLSTLVRVVPGNLGVQELFSGGAYYIVGGSLSDGLAIALFIRFLSLFLTITIGTIGTVININHFNIGELKKAWIELKNGKRI